MGVSSMPSFQRQPRAAYVEGTQAPAVGVEDLAQVTETISKAGGCHCGTIHFSEGWTV